MDRAAAQQTGRFPEKVTAFREEMAVHGRYGKPCPVCGAPVQRIVYAENETNYCARCQTGGRILADRALSRLLKKSWPRSIDELANSGSEPEFTVRRLADFLLAVAAGAGSCFGEAWRIAAAALEAAPCAALFISLNQLCACCIWVW